MKFSIIASLASICAVSANSIGAPVIPGTTPPIAYCDALSPVMGCLTGWSPTSTSMGQPDRVHGCNDPFDLINQKYFRYMYWASPAPGSFNYTAFITTNYKSAALAPAMFKDRADPSYTPIFTLRTSNGADPNQDPTSYIPNTKMTLHLRSYNVNFLHRGILLYAVNANETKVGYFTPTDQLYHAPWDNKSPAHPCQGSILHSNAEIKPSYYVFHFTAPPAGTGPITFRALLKTGNANLGAFFYANKVDLSITENTSTPPDFMSSLVFATAVNQNCNQYCAQYNLGTCDSSGLNKLASDSSLTAAVNSYQVCALPLLQAPSINCTVDIGLSTSSSSLCYGGCTNIPGASSNVVDYCAAVSANILTGNRFCMCTKPTNSDGTPFVPPQIQADGSLLFLTPNGATYPPPTQPADGPMMSNTLFVEVTAGLVGFAIVAIFVIIAVQLRRKRRKQQKNQYSNEMSKI